jgi:autotransporter translocation and assembly factor TamB
MRSVRFLFLAALAGGAAFAAGVDGKWECGVKGPDGVVRPLIATLKADGMKLTGTVNGMNGQPDIEIFNGMNHGEMVMWSSKRPIQNATVQFDYKGTISGNEMKIDIVRADGQGAPMNCTAKRAD